MKNNLAKTRTSDSYVFTANAKSAEDLAKIEEVRQTVKAINHLQRQNDGKYAVQYRVVLAGRLGENNPNAHKYTKANGRSNGPFYSMIRKDDAAFFDIYIYERV